MENNLNDGIREEIINVNPNEKTSSSLGPVVTILGIVAVLSLILNIILVTKVLVTKPSGNNEVIQAQNQPSPTPAKPTQQEAGAVQTFNITKDDNIRGDFNAPITLVEFSDFECPFCARHAPVLQKVLDNYKGKVRLVYKYYPLDFHPNSQKAAESAQCAAEQGKFWEYHDKLFSEQPNGFSTDKFKQWAGELGLDSAKFNVCLDSDKYAQKVKDDLQEGSQKGVYGTPATFVNGQFISGAVPYEQFKQLIDSLLAK